MKSTLHTTTAAPPPPTPGTGPVPKRWRFPSRVPRAYLGLEPPPWAGQLSGGGGVGSYEGVVSGRSSHVYLPVNSHWGSCRGVLFRPKLSGNNFLHGGGRNHLNSKPQGKLAAISEPARGSPCHASSSPLHLVRSSMGRRRRNAHPHGPLRKALSACLPTRHPLSFPGHCVLSPRIVRRPTEFRCALRIRPRPTAAVQEWLARPPTLSRWHSGCCAIVLDALCTLKKIPAPKRNPSPLRVRF